MVKKLLKIYFLNSFLFVIFVLILELTFHSLGSDIKKKYLKPYYGYSEFGRGTYPKNYFVKDDILGFDINKNSQEMFFYSPNGVLKIFSNNFGCFDKNENYSDYIYLGGDSFMWGYDDYKKTFGSILENSIDKKVAKCGVTNTGQMHQFFKLKKFLNQNKTFPKKIIIGHYKNDLNDDFLFPKDTVINGWMVSKPKNTKEQNSITDLIKKKEKIHNLKLKNNFFYNIKNHDWFIYLMNNSFLISALREFKNISQEDNEVILNTKVKKDKIKCNYENYNSSNCVHLNKIAINKFVEFSDLNDIDFLLILFPPISDLKNNQDIYLELKIYLDKININYIDLFNQIKKSGIAIDKFYNRDNHFSEFGMKFIVNTNLNKLK